MGDDGPDMTGSHDGRLYHATTRAKAQAALVEGISGRITFWGVSEIADYYRETVDDENESGDDAAAGVVVSAPLSAFAPADLREDTPGFEEPITTVLGCSEDDVHASWEHDPMDWRSSYDRIGSVAYHGTLAASDIRIEDD